MGSPGFVYVLLNPSIPGCVKIGKTTRDTATRAAELSAATGVPTPFLVAYEAYFKDCDRAETHVHALLEASGVRLTPNREFFSIGAPKAINIVIRAQADLGSITSDELDVDAGDKPHDETSFLDSESTEDQQSNPWDDLIAQAEAHLYGLDDELEDPARAVEFYKLAAKLGSAEAYIAIGEITGGTQGVDWIKRGAESGLPECWLELANVYAGENYHFDDIARNRDSALKCYRRFFEAVDPLLFNAEGSRLYFHLERFLDMLAGQSTPRDVTVVDGFLLRFRSMLRGIEQESERNAKLFELEKLLERHPQVVSR